MSLRRFAIPLVVALIAGLSACGSDVDSVVNALPATKAPSPTSPPDDQSDGVEAPSTTVEDDATEQTTTTTIAASPGPGGKPYVQAIAQALLDDESVPLAEDDATCIGERMVAVIGVERFEHHGVTPEDLSDKATAMDFSGLELDRDAGNRVYDTFGECGVDLRGLMLASVSEDEYSPATLSCLEELLDEENTRTLMVVSMIEGPDAMLYHPELEEIAAEISRCTSLETDSA